MGKKNKMGKPDLAAEIFEGTVPYVTKLGGENPLGGDAIQDFRDLRMAPDAPS